MRTLKNDIFEIRKVAFLKSFKAGYLGLRKFYKPKRYLKHALHINYFPLIIARNITLFGRQTGVFPELLLDDKFCLPTYFYQ